ncbi:MAG: hypothetical protein L0G49_02140 [Luteococcus sp.]|uniref:type II secretion system F family protein n=1 Tax=Luteococcus sp. TaxID=1969402 RepID=UPI002647FA9A|nr:type II secretion system F family protein [Luteococcus sp.]MDN5562569.1 hypothetical protein [Luteococcus sp.]
MSLVQIAALLGVLFGVGCVGLAHQLLPSNPDLGGALDRLAPGRSLAAPLPARAFQEDVSASAKLGLWLMRHAPWLMLGKTPEADLDLLQYPVHRFYAAKVEYGLLGLFAPTLLNLVMWLLGLSSSLPISVLASIGLAVLFSIMPNQSVAARAAKARKTFRWGLIAYIELVAIERAAGSGARPALEQAASMSDSWVFRRIAEELSRSRWAGESPWEGLTHMGNRLQLDALVDFSEVMRLSGEEGANIYEILRNRAASLRTEIVNSDLGDATAQTQKMSLPIGGLFLVFGALLMAPVMLRAVGM